VGAAAAGACSRLVASACARGLVVGPMVVLMQLLVLAHANYCCTRSWTKSFS
jgi:hypothetical protein